MRSRMPSAEAFRSRRRMTRRWICRMLSLREITRNPSWSHFSRMGVGSGEGSLHLFVPIRGLGGIRSLVQDWGSTLVLKSCFEVGSYVMPAGLMISGVGHAGMGLL